ncbi:PTS fructose transporter subunit IIC [Planctomycetota bacterium]
MREQLRKHKQYLLTGVSYTVPFIACGGILIAISIGGATMMGHGTDTSQVPLLQLLNNIGAMSFKLFPAVLSGYIAYGIADRPGLVAGMVGGLIAAEVQAGFLGAMISGLIAGHVVQWIKRVPIAAYLRPVMPILIIPIVSSVIVGSLMYLVLGAPIASLMTYLLHWLEGINQGNMIFLAVILGAMVAIDMGGPINKAAFFFGAAMIEKGNYAIMGCTAAAICIPPLGLGLATLMKKKLWSEQMHKAGIAALGMGFIGITEGAIPFAAADPLRVIPCVILGSSTAAVIAMLGGVGNQAPHGGPVVLPVIQNRLIYIVAIVVGALVTSLAINTLKSLTEKSLIEEDLQP